MKSDRVTTLVRDRIAEITLLLDRTKDKDRVRMLNSLLEINQRIMDKLISSIVTRR